jgi:hypothetical protein
MGSIKTIIYKLNMIWTAKYWAVCFRRSDFGLLKDDSISEYHLLSYEPYVTVADPFLYSYRGSNWVFYEKKALKEKRGTLWCKNLDDYDGKEIKVLEETFHLSYPYVFSVKEHIYMIPETLDVNEIRLYKCVDFPENWKFIGVILKERAVDTNLIFTSDNIFYMYSYIEEKLKVYQIKYKEFENIATYEKKLIYSSGRNLTLRGGGNFIITEKNIIRVSQDCRERYGKALFFYECDPQNPKTIWNKEWKRIIPDQIYISDLKDRNEQIEGIHTYNCNGEYEIIDILLLKRHWTVPFRKIYWYLKKGKF